MICNPRVRFGSFEVDLATGELFHARDRLSLQEKPFQILSLLLQSPGRLITRQEISSKVWSGVFVENNLCLNTAIRRLRTVLEKSDPTCKLIETVGRRGYRLCANVVLSRDGAPALVEPDGAPRLAVLPFINLNDKSERHFVDGFTEEMIVQLGRFFKHVRVISPTPLIDLRRPAKLLRQISKELKIDYVLSGSVWRIPPLLRVTAKLIGTTDQRCLWSESYTRHEIEIFRLQAKITHDITLGLFQALPKPSPSGGSLTITPQFSRNAQTRTSVSRPSIRDSAMKSPLAVQHQ